MKRGGGREEVSGGDREDMGWKCEGHQEGLLKGGGMGWVGGWGAGGVQELLDYFCDVSFFVFFFYSE